MCSEENSRIRKSALNNLDCNEGTMLHLIKRIRDKDVSIR